MLLPLNAQLSTIADFSVDLAKPTPAPGWSYQWNSSGAFGDPTNYTDLVLNSDVFGAGFDAYTAEVDYPSTGPASFLQVFPDPSSPNVNPGFGVAQQNVGDPQRYVITAFTLSTSGPTSIINGLIDDLQVGPDPLGGDVDGVNVAIHVNSDTAVFTTSIADGGSAGFGSLSLGNLNVGDTIYVAVGSHGLEGENNDIFDSTRLEYQIAQIPEPAAGLIFGLAALTRFFLRRRQEH